MASIEYVVNATDAASGVFEKIGLSADHLDQQLQDLSKRIATPEIDLKDAKFTLAMVNAAKRLDKLSAMMAEPGADLEDTKFQAEILKINAQLDRLDARHVTATVDVKTDVHRGLLSRMGGGAGGLLGSAAGGAVGLLGAGGATPYLYGAAGLLAALMAPSALPLGLGLLAGGGAAAGALIIGNKAAKQLAALNKSLASAKGPQRRDIQAQIKAMQQSSGPELAIAGAFGDLRNTALGVFAGALKGTGPGFSFAGPNQSFLTSLVGILKQLGGFIKSIGPELGQMFRASVPFLQMFVGFLEKAAKSLLPAFVQMLNEMAPFLPVISAGLLNIVKGFAGFLNAIGPSGMKASARIFVILTEGMAAALVALGHTINWLTENVPTWTRKIHHEWDILRHETAVIFDGVRHDIAHVWDQIFENTIGTVIRFGHDVLRDFNDFRHRTAVVFDGARHDIAHVWDMVFQNTIGRVIRGGHDVEARFGAIRSSIFEILNHLPGQLWNLAKTALENIIKGAASVVSRVKGFFSGFAHDVVGIFKNIWGWFSPSAVMFQGGKSLMDGLAQGIKAHEHKAVAAAAAAAHRVADAGSGVQRWAGLVSQALRMEGLSPGLLGNVLFQMQTESGGNVNAINLGDINARMGDPSRGLMQVIGATFAAYHWPGTSMNIYDPLANIAAALNYARHVYGPSLMSGGMGIGSGHGYAAGSWNVPYTGPALVHQGEMIIPAAAAAAVRAGGGGTVNNYVTVNAPPGTSPAELGRRVAEVLAAFKKNGGMIYQPGGF